MIRNLGLNTYIMFRFIILLANHVYDKMVIFNHTKQLLSWVKDKRVLSDLNRMNLNSTVELKYLTIMEKSKERTIYGFPSSPITTNSFVFATTMDAGNVPQHLTM